MGLFMRLWEKVRLGVGEVPKRPLVNLVCY